MHIFLTWLLGAIAFIWIAETIEIGLGARSIPSLKDAASLPDSECPTISVLFAARDEAEKLPDALDTLTKLDYPR